MNIDLSGKVALVTGGSGELGRVMVRTLAACGANVAIHYLHGGQRARSVQQEVEAIGRKACVVHADVTNQDDVNRMRDEIADSLGVPDIIVNNAVIQYQWKQVLEQLPDDYLSQFKSCVLHNVLTVQAFVPAMIDKRWGRVIAINSECAMQNLPTQSAYVSGKRGMDGVLRVLAREIGEHQITVNQVAPGGMISDKDRAPEVKPLPWYEEQVPLRRRGFDQDCNEQRANWVRGEISPCKVVDANPRRTCC